MLPKPVPIPVSVTVSDSNSVCQYSKAKVFKHVCVSTGELLEIKMRSKKPTLKDVAAAADVSKMTASRALRGDKDVSQINIEKVRKAASDIGYYGNHLAASFASTRSNLIGVVVPSLSNIVFSQAMSGVSHALTGTGLQPVLGVTDYDNDKEYEILRNMLSWRPVGLIVTGLDQPDKTKALLSNAGIPVVQVMDSDGEPVDSCVGFSHHRAGYDIASALIDAGRKRFAYVGCNVSKDTRAAKRKVGFQQALAEHGLSFCAEEFEDDLSSVMFGRQLACKVLKSSKDIDCIYFSNDDLATGGLCYCIDSGIAVPEKVVIAGFNGLDLLDAFPGKIATTRTFRRDIGEAAAKMILDSQTKEEVDKLQIIKPSILLGALEDV